METQVSFTSDGLTLQGILNVPDDLPAGEKRPAILVLHGFGSNKESGSCIWPARTFTEWGYVTLRFDMRSCGESEGEKNHIICLEQVEDTRNAITFMQGLDVVDEKCIGLIGSSFGAAVTVYTAGVDDRVGAAISSGGWGDGERKFRGQHVGDEAWAKFTDMMERGKKHRAETGEPLMVPRYDIVPIPEHLRQNLAPGSVMMFPADTAISMFEFIADDVVGNISPRPLLLLHSSEDSVTPTEQSVEMFKRAGQPTDLHLMAEVDHFMFAEGNPRVVSILRDWLDRYFPVAA
ncbi:MAG: alpha/beta hydrolase [Alphaproteobacteria bacterium]